MEDGLPMLEESQAGFSKFRCAAHDHPGLKNGAIMKVSPELSHRLRFRSPAEYVYAYGCAYLGLENGCAKPAAHCLPYMVILTA